MQTILTKANFKKEVLEHPSPVLVAFGAEWCGPCHMLAPILEQLHEDYAGRLKILWLDIERCPSVAATYEALDIPTLVFFERGKARHRIHGVVPKHIIAAHLQEWLQ